MSRAQISLEIMISMLVSLAIVLVVLGYFVGARELILRTQVALAGIAGAAGSYQASLLAR
jgi:uncharacterized protein (UPF0333 family)